MTGTWRVASLLLVALPLFTCPETKHPSAPQGNAGRWHAPTNSETVLVFVHGVLSDSTTCWTYRGASGSVFWPDLITLDPRFAKPAIYLASYPTQAFGGDPDYGIYDAADTVWDELQREDEHRRSPVLSKKNIIFVGHSTGAIIIKRLIQLHQLELAGKNIGVVLIASPSLGSKLGTSLAWISMQFKNEIGHELTWNNQILRDNDKLFGILVNKRPSWLQGVEAYEQYPMGVANVAKVEVAPQATADRGYFGPAHILAGTNHESSVKPPTYDHPGYTLLVDFYSTFVKNVSAISDVPSAVARPFSGANMRWLTSSGSARLVALSPDSNWVAYVEAVGEQQQVALQEVGDSDARPRRIVGLLPQDYKALSFSPDSKSMYFVRAASDDPIKSALFKSDVLGTNSRMLIDDVDSGVAVSPDGGFVAFIRGIEHATQLIICRSDGTACRVRATLPLPSFFSYGATPVWLPGENAIACVQGNVNVPRSMTVRAYATDSERDWQFARDSWWSISSLAPLGRDRLIVAADFNSDIRHRLWVIAPGNPAKSLFPSVDDYGSVTLSSDGRHLAAINRSKAVAMGIAFPSDNWSVRSLSPNHEDGGVYGAAWTSRGEIVYVESGATGRELWSMRGDGTGAAPLTHLQGNRWGDVYPRGCRDDTIVFTSFSPKPTVVLRSGDGSETKVGAGFFPDCSDNGRIIFTTYDSKNPMHSIVDRSGHVVQAHYPSSTILHPALSPDGRTVAGFMLDQKQHRWTIVIEDLSNGTTKSLWHTSLRDSRMPWIRWRPDGKSLTYLSPRGGSLEVWKIPLEGTATSEAFVDGETAFALDWSRDGSKLLYAAGKTRSNVVMLEEPAMVGSDR